MLQMTPEMLENIREDCRKLVRKAARRCATVSMLPIPVIDLANDIRLLSRLLPEITERFGLTEAQIAEMPSAQREKVHWFMRSLEPGFVGLTATNKLIRKYLKGYLGKVLGSQLFRFVPLSGSLLAGTLGYFVVRGIAYKYIDSCYAVDQALWSRPVPQPAEGHGPVARGRMATAGQA